MNRGIMSAELKTTVLGSQYMLEERLAQVIDDSHARQKFYPLVTRNMGGRQLNGYGVVIALQLAIHDYCKALPPIMAVLMQHQVKSLVEALVDDEEVKADAIRMIDEVEASQKAEQDARPAAPPRTELSDAQKQSLMRHIKRLAELYDEYADDSHNASEGHRVGGANPFYDQTFDGIYLEFYYGGPSKVWTPWGHWHFGAAQSYQFDLDGFMSRLTLRTHVEGHQAEMGYIGPVYAIEAIDGEPLPEPVLPTDRRQYMAYEQSRGEWNHYFEAK